MKPSDWIPFSKRKPKKGQSVLLFWPPGFVKESLFPDGYQESGPCTHWMPLSYPPDNQPNVEYAWDPKHNCWTRFAGPRNAPLVIRPTGSAWRTKA